MVRAIVGFELTISKLEGKYKLSQNRAEADHAGVVRGLVGEADATAAAMAGLMQAHARKTAP